MEIPKTVREHNPEVEAKLLEVETAVKNAQLALLCFGEVEASALYEILTLRMELDSLLCSPSTYKKPTIH